VATLDNPYEVAKYTSAIVEGTAMPLEEVPQEIRSFIDRCCPSQWCFPFLRWSSNPNRGSN